MRSLFEPTAPEHAPALLLGRGGCWLAGGGRGVSTQSNFAAGLAVSHPGLRPLCVGPPTSLPSVCDVCRDAALGTVCTSGACVELSPLSTSWLRCRLPTCFGRLPPTAACRPVLWSFVAIMYYTYMITFAASDFYTGFLFNSEYQFHDLM